MRNASIEFETTEPYRCGENQLEVYMDGKKLINGIQFKEGADIKDKNGNYAEEIQKGTISYRYRLMIEVPANTFVHYKITTNIYSYDHVEGMVGGLKDRVKEIEDNTKEALDSITNTKDEVSRAISTMQSDVTDLKNAANEHDNFYRKGEVIPMSAIPSPLLRKTVDSMINQIIVKNGQLAAVEGFSESDFITCYAVSGGRLGSIIFEV